MALGHINSFASSFSRPLALGAALSLFASVPAPQAGQPPQGKPAAAPPSSQSQSAERAQQKRPRRVFNGPHAKGQTPTLRTDTAPTREGAPPPADEDDADVERVETDLTNVLLTAIDKDRRFVTTLREEDIRIFENNEPQRISVFERQTDLPLSLAILIDTSASQEGVLADEQAAARAFVAAVIRPDKDTVSVISFNGEGTTEQALTNDVAKLHAAINRVRVQLPPNDPECQEDKTSAEDARCWTAVWDTVWATTNEILSHTPERTRRAIILVSDGDDTTSLTKRREAVDFAVKHNTAVYAIGIRDRDFPGGGLDRDALRKVSDETGGRAFFPVNKAELDAAFAQINQELRAQYLVAYTPSNRRRDGTFRQIKIEVATPSLRKEKLRLLYRQGYYARGGVAAAK